MGVHERDDAENKQRVIGIKWRSGTTTREGFQLKRSVKFHLISPTSYH